jgi:hypothetical protein
VQCHTTAAPPIRTRTLAPVHTSPIPLKTLAVQPSCKRRHHGPNTIPPQPLVRQRFILNRLPSDRLRRPPIGLSMCPTQLLQMADGPVALRPSMRRVCVYTITSPARWRQNHYLIKTYRPMDESVPSITLGLPLLLASIHHTITMNHCPL